MDDVSAFDHLVVVVDDVTGNADPAMGRGLAGEGQRRARESRLCSKH